MIIISNKRAAAAFSLLSFVVFLHPLHGCAHGTNQTSPGPPAIIIFGDSVVDPGNNNAILTIAKCNYPPYGKDFLGHKATGRFSNGKIPSDLIASQLGIKEYVPAYLGTNLSAYDLITGVSFASGGCGFDPLTSQLSAVITIDEQLNLFMKYKEKVKAIVGEKRAAYITSSSIYFIIAGTDDIANTYFTTPFRRFEFDLPSYINFTVQSASTSIQKLYHLGARRISVVGAPPIGCLPSQRTLAGGIERICNPTYNQAAMLLNSQLSNEMQRLNSTLPKSRIRYVDMYTPLLDIILHPSKYGFVESKRGCCGTGTFEVTQTCNSLTTFVCEDASKYVFWDSFVLSACSHAGLVDCGNEIFLQTQHKHAITPSVEHLSIILILMSGLHFLPLSGSITMLSWQKLQHGMLSNSGLEALVFTSPSPMFTMEEEELFP